MIQAIFQVILLFFYIYSGNALIGNVFNVPIIGVMNHDVRDWAY